MGLYKPRLLLLLGCAVWGSSHAVDFPHCEEPPRPPHKCFNLQCAHGTCMNVTQNGYTFEQCSCDEGWVDYYCDECCRCQPRETCKRNPNLPGHICTPEMTTDSTTVLNTTTTDASHSLTVTNDSTTVLGTVISVWTGWVIGLAVIISA